MRIDLNAPVTLDSAQAAVGNFWLWWTSQLRAMLPTGIGSRLDGALERWTISLEGRYWRLRRAGQDEDIVTLDTEAPASVTHDLIARLEPGALVRRLAVHIPPSDVLIRRIRVPASAGMHIRSVVKLQLDRLSPFAADDVQFDCRKLPSEGDGEIEIEVGIVPKATLADYDAKLAAIGLVARSFELGDGTLGFRPARANWTRYEQIQAALAAATVAALAGAIFLAPAMRESELNTLSADVAALRGPALQAAAMRDELHQLEQPLAALSTELAHPSPLDTLRTLTVTLPGDVQLGGLTVDGNAVRLEGIAHSTARILSILKRSGQFETPHLAGAPSRTVDGAGQFVIEMSVRTAPAGAPR